MSCVFRDELADGASRVLLSDAHPVASRTISSPRIFFLVVMTISAMVFVSYRLRIPVPLGAENDRLVPFQHSPLIDHSWAEPNRA
jgi:hypothetical protein